MTTVTDDLRYPIGPFTLVQPITPELRKTAVDALAALPERMREAVATLDERQLDTPYRPDGWTVRQVVHHVADSHMNGFIRLKLALTEARPTIKPYDENAWSALPDMRLPIDVSLQLLESLHTRWVAVYHGMTGDQFARSFVHPEHGMEMTLDYHLQNYAWHSRHHVAHITELRLRERW